MGFYKIEQTEEIRDEVRLPARETACRLYDKEKSAQQKIPRERESKTKELPTKYLPGVSGAHGEQQGCAHSSCSGPHVNHFCSLCFCFCDAVVEIMLSLTPLVNHTLPSD